MTKVSENAQIRVLWEDKTENYTQQKRKKVESYFKSKYGVKKVNVIFKPTKINEITGEVEVDISENIMDDNYQKKLFESWLNLTNHKVEWERLLSLNKKVQEKLEQERDIDYRHRTWKIKKVEFDNFLSFGEGNVVDYEKLNGVTVVSSNPPNFGGKTIFCLDLLLFLLFNTTTRTTKTLEIFNRYSNKDRVRVKGYLIIDNEEYSIERGITRKKTKKGEWAIKTELKFQKIMEDGSVLNLEGEQRRETDELIKKSIGTYDDFMSTIISTASNLENLIETKPTERGKILSKFVGLEVLENKEKIVKEMYSSWNKTLKMNIYDTEELKNENKIIGDRIIELKTLKEQEERELKNIEKELVIFEKEKDLYFSQKTKIDESLTKVKPNEIEEEIVKLEKRVLTTKNLYEQREKEIKNIGKTGYNIDNYSDLLKEEKEIEIMEVKIDSGLNNFNNQIKNLENSEFCPVCKRAMEDINNTKEIQEIKKLIKKLDIEKEKGGQKILKVRKNLDKEKQLKSNFDEVEKIKITLSRIEIDLERWGLEIQKKNDLIGKYNSHIKDINNNISIEEKIVDVNYRKSKKSLERDKSLNGITTNNSKITNDGNTLDKNKKIIEVIKKEEEIDNVFRVYIQMVGKNGIGKIVMNNIIPSINNELERLLSDTTEFDVILELNEKKEVDFHMMDRETGVSKPLFAGSGYEKTLASLALRCVLTRISCLPKPNIIVLDEVLGKVSNENLEKVEQFFGKVKDYFPIVMLITHNDMVKDWSEKIITIGKKENISSLCWV
jgi:DNA repair exonuclease SbcCD ATPase subunit|tara:strand:+ start:70009 stop:72348 length:2340 start_codon:yes stop_codon:yes gene_type:complete